MIEGNPTSFGRGKSNKILHEHSLSHGEYDDNVDYDVDKDETEVEEEDFSDKDGQSMISAVIDETQAEEEDFSDKDDQSMISAVIDETQAEEEDFSDKDDQNMISAVIDETQAEEEDFSDEDDKSTTSTIDDNDTDPWHKLREESVNDLNPAWEEQVEQYITQGLLKNEAERRASNHLLPAYRKRLRVLYLDYLKWHQVLKTDPVHKEVMKTLRRFMDDEEMDYAEAAEAAINKRKYLLNRVIKYEDISEETSSDNENEELSHTTARKRKYNEV